MGQESTDTVGPDRPDDPHREEADRQREGHVQVRVRTAEDGLAHVETMSSGRSPTDRADSRQQPEPVRGKDEQEDCGKIPEGLLGQLRPEDTAQEVLQRFDDPLGEILETLRNHLDVPRGQLGEHNQTQRDDRHGHHRVRHGKYEVLARGHCLSCGASAMEFEAARCLEPPEEDRRGDGNTFLGMRGVGSTRGGVGRARDRLSRMRVRTHTHCQQQRPDPLIQPHAHPLLLRSLQCKAPPDGSPCPKDAVRLFNSEIFHKTFLRHFSDEAQLRPSIRHFP